MERLTFDGSFCDIAKCAETPGGSFCENGACSQRKVWERLKAYEDTGLEPEEIEDAVVGAKLLAKSQLVSAFGVAAERLRELAEADKDGRLVVLPCKVGDTVYRLQYIEQTPGYFVVGVVGIKLALIWLEEFGKTVFLTREEAEKALEAIKNG